MRKRNWREYNKRLVQRGSLTFLIDSKVMKTLGPQAQKKQKGRPLEFSDQLILLLLMIKIHYKMPYRMLEGFSCFFFEQFKKMKIPTYSLTCKRAKGLSAKLPKLSSCRPKTVIVDGAYDDRDVRDLIRERGSKGLIPPPSNAVCHGTDLERDDAIKVIRAFGGDKIAKSIWGKLSGYSRRALVETIFSRYKKMFGERAFSRTQERIVLENRLKCVLLNKMTRAAA